MDQNWDKLTPIKKINIKQLNQKNKDNKAANDDKFENKIIKAMEIVENFTATPVINAV